MRSCKHIHFDCSKMIDSFAAENIAGHILSLYRRPIKRYLPLTTEELASWSQVEEETTQEDNGRDVEGRLAGEDEIQEARQEGDNDAGVSTSQAGHANHDD